MFPGGKAYGAKVAFRLGGAGDPQAVRADQAGAVRADERQQAVLPLGALVPELGEAGRDHAERAYAQAERRLGRLEDDLRREADDREVDALGHLLDRGVAGDARDWRAVPVHGIGGAGEPALDDVAEELPADRAGTRGRAEHRHARGSEEGLEGGDDGSVVALVHPRAVGLAGRDRELELHRPLGEPPRHVEARVAEDPQHGDVPGQHLGDEALDAVRGGERRELLEQARADAAAVELVGDGEGHLGGRRVTQPVVGRHRHHALASVRRERPDQRAAVGPVRVERVADQRGRERREPVEAQVEALRGEALEEREERGPVGLGRRAEPERAPVLEDDVEHLRFRGHGPHHAVLAARRGP